MTTTMNPTVSVDRYFAAWNETDAGRRLEAVAEAWSPDGHYVDPVAEATGHDAISAMIGDVHARYPGVTLRCSSDIDSHHDVVRFDWEILDAEGKPVLAGFDVARVADDGRLVDVRGFFRSTTT